MWSVNDVYFNGNFIQVLRGGVMTLIRLTVAMAAERIRKSFTTVQMYLSRMGPEIMISLSNNSTTNN